LFVPGSNPRAIEKARTLPVDAVILDLEDAVGPGEKDAARSAVRAAVEAGTHAGKLAVVRINPLTGAEGPEDLKAAAGADAVLLPKLESAADLAAARLLAPKAVLWAMIETPLAVLQVNEIAQGAAALVLGSNDLLKAMGARHRTDRANLHYAMAGLVTAARAHDCLALDASHNDFQDEEGFAASCALGRDFGFDGKTLIHPSQIEAAQAAFAPSADEIAEAKALLAEFGRPENRGRGVIAFRGRMVERLHADMAQRLLDEKP
jgi:citrate lyase subunit beta/citryl-CoA lyase